MDRARLESDLKAVVDVLLLALPTQLVRLDLEQLIAKLGPAGPTLARLAGLPTRGTWDLQATLFGACSRIAALPDDQLRAVLALIRWELERLLDPDALTTPAIAALPPTPAEWDAIAAVVATLRDSIVASS